jgi:hypothetical protein
MKSRCESHVVVNAATQSPPLTVNGHAYERGGEEEEEEEEVKKKCSRLVALPKLVGRDTRKERRK